MSLVILFGLPASGKTFVGNLIKDHFDYFFLDGDTELPQDMKEAIDNQMPVTDSQRDRFFEKIIYKVQKLQETYPDIVLAQTFIKEKYRVQILKTFPKAKFYLIETDTTLREARLVKRTEYNLELNYARAMVENFDPPTIPFLRVQNNSDGTKQLLVQLKDIFQIQN